MVYEVPYQDVLVVQCQDVVVVLLVPFQLVIVVGSKVTIVVDSDVDTVIVVGVPGCAQSGGLSQSGHSNPKVSSTFGMNPGATKGTTRITRPMIRMRAITWLAFTFLSPPFQLLRPPTPCKRMGIRKIMTNAMMTRKTMVPSPPQPKTSITHCCQGGISVSPVLISHSVLSGLV